MSNDLHFETPENIRVLYRSAGLGTRFMAWLVDMILISAAVFVIFIVALICGASIDIFGKEFFTLDERTHQFHATMYFLAVAWLIFSLGSLVYFGACELLMRGQTLGKRWMKIRVAKADGFSLDPGAVFMRTIFRVVDHSPPLWIVPLVTEKSQRLGDLVAGTVVMADDPVKLGGLQREPVPEQPLEQRFQFDVTALKRLRPQDVQAAEQLLKRFASMLHGDRQQLAERIVTALAARMQVEAPPPRERLTFLEDMLASEYRRQHRRLG